MGLRFSKADIIILLLGIAIFIYILVKATISSFTIDESFSYLNYVHTSFMDIISFKSWYTNNHIMNSLLMKYSEQLFGNSEISLRLPNLLLFSVYMVYSYLLFKRINQFLAIIIFVLLCTNNSLIDLFGLARGYGLSFGFMLMSLYHFVQSFYDQKTKNVILFHVGALFGVLSSFILIDFYLALIIIYNVVIFIDSKFILHKKFHFIASNKVHIIPVLINIIILYEPIRRVIMNSDLDFGGRNGFYSDTVTSLIYYSLNSLSIPSIVWIIAKIIFTGIVLLSFIIIIRMIIRGDQTFFIKHKGLIISNLLIIFLSIAIILQHIIFRADYPIARFSLFLFPIYIIHLGFLLMYFNDYYKRVVSILALSLALISCTSFILKADLRSCSEWGFDMETKNMIQILTEYHSKNDNDSAKIKIGINWLFEPTINFYRQTKNINWLLPADRMGISSNDDYYYVFKDEMDQLNPDSYKIIYEFTGINTVLLKNNKSD
ncbi:MAG: hypothetical protein ABIJ97_04690 [Bacteroidota bacterium]